MTTIKILTGACNPHVGILWNARTKDVCLTHTLSLGVHPGADVVRQISDMAQLLQHLSTDGWPLKLAY